MAARGVGQFSLCDFIERNLVIEHYIEVTFFALSSFNLVITLVLLISWTSWTMAKIGETHFLAHLIAQVRF